MKVNFIGTQNTRDLGNLTNKYGEKIKKNLLYRSDNLSNLTDDDISKCKSLGIERIIDFRSLKEKTKEPNRLINNIEYIELPIEIENEFLENLLIDIEKNNYMMIKSKMCDFYKNLITKHYNVYKKFLELLIDKKVPTLFHCTAGKDRTGWATFIILYILDFKIETIIDDYLQSNYYLDTQKIKNTLIKKKLNAEVKNLIFKVNKYYIDSSLSEIKKKFISVDNYLQNILNISVKDKNILKSYYLFNNKLNIKYSNDMQST